MAMRLIQPTRVESSTWARHFRRVAESRDQASWEALVVEFGPQILNVCSRVTRNQSLTDDAVQEVFLKLGDEAQRLATVVESSADGIETARRVVARIACNTAVAIMRSRSRAQRREQTAALYRERLESIDIEKAEILQSVDGAVQDLSDEYRLPVIMRFYGGLQYSDIAEALACPVGTIKARVHRGLKKLREQLLVVGLCLTPLQIEEAGSALYAVQMTVEPAQYTLWKSLLTCPQRSPLKSKKGLSLMTKIALGIISTAACITLIFAFNVRSEDAVPQPSQQAVQSTSTSGDTPKDSKSSTDANKVSKSLGSAEDWPCWRGPRGDGVSPLKGIRTDWKGGLRKVWSVNDLCAGKKNPGTWSAPSISGSKLVIPGRKDEDDVLACFDAHTGAQLWRKTYAAPREDDYYGTGAAATPFIDGNNVYTFGRSGDLVCWNLDDGNIVWRKNVKADGGRECNFGLTSSPLVVGDKVVVMAVGTATAVAYDKRDGKLLWRYAGGNNNDPGCSSPVLAKLQPRDQILVFSPDVDCKNGERPTGGLAGLDVATGQPIWKAPWRNQFYDAYICTPAVSNDIVVTCSASRASGSQALRIGVDGAKQLWTHPGNDVLSSFHSDPVIIDSHVYGYSSMSGWNGSRTAGSLQCVELQTGKLCWSSQAEGLAYGTLVYVDGHLLCLTMNGRLILVKCDPAKYTKVAEFDTGLTIPTPRGKAGFVWTVPVIAHGCVYVRHVGELICYQLK
jgi:outer membrane protein assembly factor BamB